VRESERTVNGAEAFAGDADDGAAADIFASNRGANPARATKPASFPTKLLRDGSWLTM
jgi:hypothetical protein